MPEGAIPATMRALILHDFDWQPDSLVAAEIPTPHPGPGQVLVRMAAAPVNPTDLSFLRGRSSRPPGLPAVPGQEGSGHVVAAGSGLLGRLLLGRRVACAPPAGVGGAWAEYMVTSATRCVPLRKTVSLETGAALIVNPMTAAALIRIARRGGHRAVVNTAAASALGRMLARLAAAEGIEMIHIVRSNTEAARLESIGAKHVLDSTMPDFDHRLIAHCRDLNATLALDAIAGPMTARLLEALPHGGKVVVYGNLSQSESRVPAHTLIRDDKRVDGFYLANWLSKEGRLRGFLLALRVQAHLEGALKTEIRARLPLAEAYDGICSYSQSMGRGKIWIIPPQASTSD